MDENDEVWVELRHMFIADVYKLLHERIKEFHSKNKAAQAVGEAKQAAYKAIYAA